MTAFEELFTILQLSENLVHDWSNLAEMEQIPLNDSMITFGMKLAIVSMFGSDLCSDEAIKDIRHNFLLVSKYFSEVMFFCLILQMTHLYTNTQKHTNLNNLYRNEQN